MTLLEILSYRAQHSPQKKAYIFLENGETESGSLTYGELDRQARAIAFHLQPFKGERTLLLYPSGLEFIAAFFGCLYAGVVAVPVYPPRRNQKLSRLLALAHDAQPKIALTTRSTLTKIEKRWSDEAELAPLKLVATDTIKANAQGFVSTSVTPDSLAFLQYTSGSTGTPKGVMVTHGNIIHNQQIIQQAFGHSEQSIVVGWLPLFHDMGLIGNVLQPMYLGIPCILMPPVAFLQKPIRWLKAISNYRATTSGGPNFAYDLCVQKIKSEQLTNLDLSSWDLAYTGAEPVRSETLEKFSKKFANCGFNETAFYPCYGMAESTLFATGGDKNQSPVIQGVLAGELEQNSALESEISSPVSRRLVGIGHPYLNTTVTIVNPESLTRCETEQVGEIWVSGPSIAAGYWNRPQATQEIFHAYLKDTGDGPFLRTGDLGFFSKGELFFTGRLKDLIIIRGRNHYPQDIELTVESSHPALRNNCSAAFSVEREGEERLVIVGEVERTYLRKLNTTEVIKEIQIALSTEHELDIDGVVLLKTGSIPKTSSGKIQRRACKQGFLEGSLNSVEQWQRISETTRKISSLSSPLTPQYDSSGNQAKTVEEISAWLINKIAESLQLVPKEIDTRQPFAVYGINSLKAVSIAAELEEWLGMSIAPTIVYDYPTIQALANYLGQTTPSLESSAFVSNPQTATEAIAIIGKGCRFPKANNPQAFWSLLRSGNDAITKVPVSRWQSDDDTWGGFLEQVDQFEPQFFNIAPREASNMDPQQRLLLEVSWEALENAGLAAEELAGRRGGVFIGISSGDYANLNSNLANTKAYYGTGNALSIAANRLSYFFDWHGPSWAVDTACSSSLVAVHQACQSLLQGECNLALAGGVNLMLTPQLTLTFSEAKMMATDGRCKTFDAGADGYVRSEGCGVVVLKRLADALADGDHIQAVIRGSAVNQDGLTNGLTAPNGNYQQEVIRLALANAGVKPNQISYVETHGTGTALGDPIEVNSLKAVLMTDREPNQPCWVGSVKTNIGHLEAAAGIAGLIKTVLSLENSEIPPHLHLKQLNPHIELEQTPIDIPMQLQTWSSRDQPRLAGVSAFGFGGTNAHVILEEAPVQNKRQKAKGKSEELSERSHHILTLSAKSQKALLQLAQRYHQFLGNNSTAALTDICFTANIGRSHFNHRLAIITSDKQELTDKLAKVIAEEAFNGVFSRKLSNSKAPQIAFLFTGQGSQYINMGRQLYETHPVFRRALDQCDRILQSYLDQSLLEVIYPENTQDKNSSLLNQTAYTQPALFAIEYALVQLWQSWGIQPDVVMGHSVGEYVAATVAGVFSLEDGLKLIAHRGRLMQQLPTLGEMVAVMASSKKVNQLIAPYTDKVAIAAINGPENIVISGEANAIKTVTDILEIEEINTKQLQVSHAFHSPLMDPMLAEFEAVARQITYNQPRIPLISTLTGTTADDRITTASYWVNHVRQPVKFAHSMESLYQQGYQVFLEIGAKPILLGMGKQCLPSEVGVWLPSVRPKGQAPELIASSNPQSDDWQQMLQSLAELYVRGVAVNWSGFDRDSGHNKVVLPTYPFQRERYWIETQAQEKQGTESSSKLTLVPNTNLPYHIFCLSGSSQEELFNLAKRTVSIIQKYPELELEHLCFLANSKQSNSEHRLAIVAKSTLDIQRKLTDFIEGKSVTDLLQGNLNKHQISKIAFLFSGHGCQHLGMGKELYETHPIFRQAFDECEQILSSHLKYSLYDILYSDAAKIKFELEDIDYSSPALFTLQYALVKLWKSWGIEPSLVLGPSLGENAAAHTAGVFNLNSILTTIALVNKEIKQSLLPNNIAIGVITSEERLKRIIQPHSKEISIISYGGSRNVITGTSQAIETVEKTLIEQKIVYMPMPGDPYGSHSSNIDSFSKKHSEILKNLNCSIPHTDYLSTVTGKLVSSEIITSEYWIDHLRLPVQLSKTAKTLHQLNYDAFVEIGPQAITLGAMRTCLPEEEEIWLPSLRKLGSDWKHILTTLGELYIRGVSVNWEGFYQCYSQRQVSLPKNIFAEKSDKTFIINSLSNREIEQINQLLQATGELSDAEKALAPKLLNLIFKQEQKKLNSEQNIEDWFYKLIWKPLPLNPPQVYQNNLENTSQHWLIFADSSQIGETLSQSLQKEGHFCTLVYPEPNYGDRSSRVYGITPDDAKDYQRLSQAIKEDTPSPVTGIIHLWSLNAEFTEELTPSTLEKAKILGCGSVLYLLQALNPITNSQMPRLWLITKGCQDITINANHLQLQEIPLWGLGKVIALEHPEYGCRCLDLEAQSDVTDSASILIKEILNSDAESQIAYHHGLRHVARLVRQNEQREDKQEDLSISSDASYLITGGLGDLGLEVTQWLVDKGARNIVLTSRNTSSVKAQKIIQNLTTKGATISVLLGDISQQQEIAKIIQDINSSLPPLKGVIHVAGIIDDCSLQQTSWASFLKAIAPKVDGSWYLHKLTQDIPLDFFVCFSSMASVMGSVGQGNYAAANAFMDALVHYRRSLGLPGLTINWGPWAEIGMASRLGANYQAQIASSGINFIPPEKGIKALNCLMSRPESQIGVFDIDWYQFEQRLPHNIYLPLLAELISVKSIPIEEKNNSLLSDFKNLSTPERAKKLNNYLQDCVAKALGMRINQIDVDQPLMSMGVDSLMAIEIRNQVQTDLEVDIPITKLMEDINLTTLVIELDEQLTQADSEYNIVPQKEEVLPTNVYPLSYGQKALWFLWKLEPKSSAYNLSYSCRIASGINIKAFRDAWQILCDRHPLLHSIFIQGESEPVQKIIYTQKLDFKVLDTSNLRNLELEKKVKSESQQPFNLESQSVVRLRLFNISISEHILLLTIHHIAVDGWSMGILIEEFQSVYKALSLDAKLSLPPLKNTYRDYVGWQRNLLAEKSEDKLWNYWQEKLQGDLPVLNIPTDKPRPPVQTYNGDSVPFSLSKQLTRKLKELSKREKVTLYTLILAAYKVLLYRYTGQEEILVGSPTSGRTKSEFMSVVGYFVDPIVMRSNISGNPSFRDFLNQTSKTVVEALAHQDFPFALLVERLQPARDPSYAPIFQAMFALYNSTQMESLPKFLVGEQNIEGLKIEPWEINQQEGLSDVFLEMLDDGTCILGSFKYNTDLFEEETITRMASHFQTLLEGITANPQQKVSKLPLLTEIERHQLLVEWNNTAREYPTASCIHQLFEGQVERTPDAIAVVFESEQVTYKQLNQRANQLAHHLQSLGVQPEVLVGICVERSIEMVVGLLGILKAGGAYVPFDPSYPAKRLSYMLNDSGVGVLVTQNELVESIPEHNALNVCLDSDGDVIEQKNRDNLEVGVDENNLAYVLYTSGSTGQPKGVQICHRGVANFLNSMLHSPGLTSKDSLYAVTTISFDIAALELYLPLMVGAKVIVGSREIASDGNRLLSELLHSKTTVMQATPATWQMLLTAGWKNDYPLKVLCGGEALSVSLTHQILETGSRLWNMYGPTEATIWSTVHNLSASKPVTSTDHLIASIGRPIANTQVYILDSQLQPVPIGVPGELHISGDGLARGYLNRPELTSERFISNPFNSKSKLYKTGDLARYDRDGNIEFLGRIDNQVKIRGFRIELGEIETALTSHPQINQAVVMATEENTGNKRLVAYLVANSEITTVQLREYIKAQLPDYMVPVAFVTLERLPLTLNGKIDRKALPAVDIAERANQYIAPSTQSEQIIANIFAEVLNVENIGINDNFFELGGHSLLATQLISRIRESFSLEIPLRELFSSPTVAQLDQTITKLRNGNNRLTLPSIQPREETAQRPLSWAQERLWFLNQLEGKSATYNMPAAVRIIGNLDIDALQQTIWKVVQRHEVLRTSFQALNGTPIQVIHPKSAMKITMVDLQQLATNNKEHSVIEQAQLEATTPFDLENGPLIRCSLLQLSTSEYVLLWTMHHIVSDSWSMGVFIQEISSLYQSFTKKKEIISSDVEGTSLLKLPVQYADFAVWQRQYLSGEILETQLDYWKQQLNSAPNLLQLPTDFPRPTTQTYQGRSISFRLNTDLTTKLKTLSRESGTTLFMTLYGAFSTLLHRYSGQSDILVGTPIANRNHSEIEGLIGFFVNTLVLKTHFDNNPSFNELLAQVRETTLQAYDHQDVPFEQIVEALQPQRDLSYSPLFQVMFVLQNAPMGNVELPGVTLSLIQLESTIAKFDLTLSMTETDQGLAGEWEYNTALFKGETIERIVDHFKNLLEAIVEDPFQNVDNLNLLCESERHQLLVKWNDTATNYPSDQCIHQLFEEQVEKTPDAIAVVFESEPLTYQQLNQRANQLAHHLQTLGVGPEVLVGICVERSIEMVVGVLGILKAGGAYVPLDPNYPPSRLSYMLTDSGVQVLLTQHSLLESLSSNTAQVVCLDNDWGRIEQQCQENLDVRVDSGNLAYVIYTSGSTGRPKGVMNTHQGIRNRLLWMQDTYTLDSSDRVLQKTPFSFDVSVWEFFWPLITGARIVVAKPEGHKDSAYLVNLILTEQITTIHFVPSMLQVFLFEPNLANCSCLKRVFCSGETLPVELTQRFFAQLSCGLHNLYGPTEAAIDVTFWQCQPQENVQIVPIGRPIANTQLYILNSQLQPVPVGVPGELHIGGDSLARGYLNRPELTSEKFISNPFRSKSKLYKTGDLARYDRDGNIEFLGRIDNQVKIRGFRIELGEIETVLTSHLQINQAVVMATEENTGHKRLVAYLVASSEITTAQLREYIKARLPEYMVPSAFVTLESLPLTPNGKVDRKALPAVDYIKRETEYVAPRTAIELKLTQIWSSILNVQPVGAQDNFFELGGHSLLAVRLMSEIQQQFQKKLPLATLFQYPTVEQLASFLSSSVSPKNSILVDIKTSGSQPPLFCIHPVGGNVLCYADLARYLDSDRPVYGLQSLGLDGQQQPLTSIEEMASNYLEVIKQIQSQGPYHLIGWSIGGAIAYEMAQQLQAKNESVALLALIDTYAPTLIPLPSDIDRSMIINQLAQDLGGIYGQQLDISLETLRKIKPDEQVDYLFEQAKQQAIFPPEIQREQMLALWEVFQANLIANYHYQAQAYSDSIILLNASEALPELSEEQTHGWDSLVLGDIQTHTIIGDHYTIMKSPQVECLAEKLNEHLKRPFTD
ncbi:MAG: amino acid adenylation domain-containing protein [Cyanobacteria bacterium P01_F01_bin.150]